MYRRVYELPSATLFEYESKIITIFHADCSESCFAPPRVCGQVEQFFIDAAHEMGYSDIMRYSTEHELAHQMVAIEQGQVCSPIVWHAAHGTLDLLTQDEKNAEEHLVNRLQQFVALGIEDSYGCLRSVFGERLEEVAVRFLAVARPWLKL